MISKRIMEKVHNYWRETHTFPNTISMSRKTFDRLVVEAPNDVRLNADEGNGITSEFAGIKIIEKDILPFGDFILNDK